MVCSKKGGVSGQNNGKLAMTVKNDVRIGSPVINAGDAPADAAG